MHPLVLRNIRTAPLGGYEKKQLLKGYFNAKIRDILSMLQSMRAKAIAIFVVNGEG